VTVHIKSAFDLYVCKQCQIITGKSNQIYINLRKYTKVKYRLT